MDILNTIRGLKQKQKQTTTTPTILHTRPQLQAATHDKHGYAVNINITDNSLGGPDAHDKALVDGEAECKNILIKHLHYSFFS